MKKETQKYFGDSESELKKKNHILKRWLALSVFLSGSLLALDPIDDQIIENKVREQYESIQNKIPPLAETPQEKDWYVQQEKKRHPFTFKELSEQSGFERNQYFEDVMTVHKINERIREVEFVRSENKANYKVVAHIEDPSFYGLEVGKTVRIKGDMSSSDSRGNWNYIMFRPQDLAFYPVENIEVPKWKGND